MMHDVVIVGAGPAGLTVAIESARRGLAVAVLERGHLPIDKACGEGIMPAGCAVLSQLGVRDQLTAEDCSPIEGIRYLRAEGPAVSALLPAPGGLGIRRTALSAVLAEKARAVGVCIAEGQSFESLDRSTSGITVVSQDKRWPARFVVAADGLSSPVRRLLGWEKPITLRRYGLRRHFHITPWTQHVEVYVTSGVEAYVTPAGSQRIGIAFLWDKDRIEQAASFPSLLARFPALRDRIGNAPPDSTPRGAGPLLRRATQLYDDRVALVGDAAGYVDAITGEGLSLALPCAMSLASVLPEVIAQQRPDPLRRYAQTHRHLFRKYAVLTHAVLGIARRPWLRNVTLDLLCRWPQRFEQILAAVMRPDPALCLPEHPDCLGTMSP